MINPIVETKIASILASIFDLLGKESYAITLVCRHKSDNTRNIILTTDKASNVSRVVKDYEKAQITISQ